MPDVTVERGKIVWRLDARDAEELAYQLMRSRSWEHDGHQLRGPKGASYYRVAR